MIEDAQNKADLSVWVLKKLVNNDKVAAVLPLSIATCDRRIDMPGYAPKATRHTPDKSTCLFDYG